MATSFDEFMQEIEDEARTEGPEAVAELEALHAHFALARQVAQLRHRCGMTQVDLATRSGIPQSEISRIERGAANPTVATLSALGGPLGASLSLSAQTNQPGCIYRPQQRLNFSPEPHGHGSLRPATDAATSSPSGDSRGRSVSRSSQAI